jgi:hypothetical protein
MGDFFQISSSSVNFLLASVSTLVENTMPVILPLLGLFIGIWIFGGVVKIGHPVDYGSKLRERQEELAEEGSARYAKWRYQEFEKMNPEDRGDED